MDLKAQLDALHIPFPSIDDPTIRETFAALYGIIENLAATNNALQEKLQQVCDELNRLKGEQGKPDIKPNTGSSDSSDSSDNDHSSESERKKRKKKKPRRKDTKKDKIIINRTKDCPVDKSILPADAIPSGYEYMTIQDLKIETDNILFKKEVYYSPSQKKTYVGQLPPGYEGGFGPTIKAQVLIMKNVCNMSQSKILDYMHHANIIISAGTISNMLIKNQEQFHQEKADIVQAGLAATDYQQIDDTSARVNGENWYTHVLGNPFYTAYFTTPRKNRLTVLDILNGHQKQCYCLNEEAFELLEQLGVAKKHLKKLQKFKSGQLLSEEQMETILDSIFSSPSPKIKTRIREAAAIAAYHQQTDWPVIKILFADDAPQFKLLTSEMGLCWVHDGRHYKKLKPVTPYYAQKLDDFLTQYWDFYAQLLDYKEAPSLEKKTGLSAEFDTIFATQTGYEQLDDRIDKTRQKKDQLLLVLKYPKLPLHNNDMELGARTQVRKRDVSLHTITQEGTKANDTFLTITQTCRKLKVNTFDYIKDRISQKLNMMPLHKIIQMKIA